MNKPNDDAEPSPASAGSHNAAMATARLSAANTWLQEEIKRLRLTDEEREAIERAKSRLGTSDGDWHADDVLAALLERLG
jgi:hypothetical protein